MESRAKFLGHPLHPILIVFPLGLLVTSVLVDLLFFATNDSRFPFVALVMIVGGVIGGLVAAIFGFIDYSHIPNDTRAKRIATLHAIGNVVVLLLFVASAFLRWQSVDYVPMGLAFGLSLIGLALGGMTGWLGGELVDRLGVGVDNGANLNAPNSLSGRPASAGRPREADVKSSAQ